MRTHSRFPSSLTKLTGLSVSSSKITELPPSLGRLTNLVAFGARNLALAGLPREMRLLTKLIHLRLGGNKLRFIDTELGTAWSKLEELDLGNNNLTEMSSAVLQHSTLQRIDLGQNRIRSLQPLLVGSGSSMAENTTWIVLDGNPACSTAALSLPLEPRWQLQCVNGFCDDTRTCSYTNANNGACDHECCNSNCFWDGGDCAYRKWYGKRYGNRASFHDPPESFNWKA